MIEALKNFRDRRSASNQTFAEGGPSTGVVEVAVEYVGHAWVVSLRNPGQRHWVVRRSTTQRVEVRNLLGQKIREVPAVETFATPELVQDFLRANVPNHRLVPRKQGEIEELFEALRGPAK